MTQNLMIASFGRARACAVFCVTTGVIILIAFVCRLTPRFVPLTCRTQMLTWKMQGVIADQEHKAVQTQTPKSNGRRPTIIGRWILREGKLVLIWSN